jgi:chromosome segregation ATPase
MTIKASTLNFVRDKAKEAQQLGELHEALTEVVNRDRELKDSKVRLDKLNADCARAENDLKGAQQKAALVLMDHDAVANESKRLKKEAEDIVGNASKRANEIIAAGEVVRDKSTADWDRALDDKREQLVDVVHKLKSADADLESKRKEYAELEKQHEDLVRKHSTLLGALAAMKSSL